MPEIGGEIRLKRNDLLSELIPMQGIVERKATIPVLSHLLLASRVCPAGRGRLPGAARARGRRAAAAVNPPASTGRRGLRPGRGP